MEARASFARAVIRGDLGLRRGSRITTERASALRLHPGYELKLANGVALIGKFDGEFASHAQTYAGTGTLRVSW
jgi:hypothetical protein